MNAPRVGGASGAGRARLDFHTEGTSEIVGPPGLDRSRPVLHADLLPGEQDASLAVAYGADPLAPLTGFLGEALTVGSRAWSRGALHDLRMLQKMLVAASLKEDGEARAECLAALMVVETNVQWRLRLQQMAMSEEDGSADGAGGAP